MTEGLSQIDIGRIDEPFLVFGGPYSNRQATEALIAEARRLGIPPERCLCTGDVVAYCAEPAETVALIRDWGCAVVMGNCEESLGSGAADCGCGFEEGSACDLLSAQWYAYSMRHLDDDARAWMAARPRRIGFEWAGRGGAAIHGAWAGGFDSISRFVFASQPDTVFDQEFDALGVEVVLAGHCGLPFAWSVGSRLWLNAGVIGMPANDGSPETWYMLLQPDGTYSFHSLRYDHAAAARAMRRAGLAEGYALGLETGLWPSLDVLPEAERRATGKAIRLVA
jgi:hypothetical protein